MNIAINGLGRIGKQFLIIALQKKLPWKFFVNDPSDIDFLIYSLKHDSIHPVLSEVSAAGKNMLIGKTKISVCQEIEPEKLPWKQNNIDLVVECTGKFTNRKGASKHLIAGAKKVLISARAKNVDSTILPGVNEKQLKKEHKIISAGSCTTNCIAPMIKVLDNAFKVKSVHFVTTHAYTSSQFLIDGHNKKDIIRGRAAALNIIPTSSGASEAIAEALPHFKGKISGYALRVPVIDGSYSSVVAKTSKSVSVKQINDLFKKVSKKEMKGIIEYSEEPLVSTDIINNPHSCIFDAKYTSVQDDMVLISGWYDNEWGYANRLVNVAEMILK